MLLSSLWPFPSEREGRQNARHRGAAGGRTTRGSEPSRGSWGKDHEGLGAVTSSPALPGPEAGADSEGRKASTGPDCTPPPPHAEVGIHLLLIQRERDAANSGLLRAERMGSVLEERPPQQGPATRAGRPPQPCDAGPLGRALSASTPALGGSVSPLSRCSPSAGGMAVTALQRGCEELGRQQPGFPTSKGLDIPCAVSWWGPE